MIKSNTLYVGEFDSLIAYTESGGDINAVIKFKHIEMPLIILFVQMKQYDSVHYLIDHGANLDVCDSEGDSLLANLTYLNKREDPLKPSLEVSNVIEKVIVMGININPQNKLGEPLMVTLDRVTRFSEYKDLIIRSQFKKTSVAVTKGISNVSDTRSRKTL